MQLYLSTSQVLLFLSVLFSALTGCVTADSECSCTRYWMSNTEHFAKSGLLSGSSYKDGRVTSCFEHSPGFEACTGDIYIVSPFSLYHDSELTKAANVDVANSGTFVSSHYAMNHGVLIEKDTGDEIHWSGYLELGQTGVESAIVGGTGAYLGYGGTVKTMSNTTEASIIDVCPDSCTTSDTTTSDAAYVGGKLVPFAALLATTVTWPLIF